MRAIYKWEREELPMFRAGRIHRRRAKAIVVLAARFFGTTRPLVVGGRWYGGGTYEKKGLLISGEYIARATTT